MLGAKILRAGVFLLPVYLMASSASAQPAAMQEGPANDDVAAQLLDDTATPDAPADNFHAVNAQLYRSAEPGPDAYTQFRALGIKTVLSVEDYSGSQELAEHEKQLVEAAGLRFLWVPMSGIFKPSVNQLDQALAAVNDAANQPILVHCQFGKDRTGLVVASYRIRHDHWTREAATQEMYKYGHSPLLGWWDDVLADIAAE